MQARRGLTARQCAEKPWVYPAFTNSRSLGSSARPHAEIRSEDSEFFVHDAGSRNGVAMAVRGERALSPGQKLMLGDQILRVERV